MSGKKLKQEWSTRICCWRDERRRGKMSREPAQAGFAYHACGRRAFQICRAMAWPFSGPLMLHISGDSRNQTSLSMTGVCPICRASAQKLPRTGDATAFHCPLHGDFKVADTVFAEAKAKDHTRDEWEAALDKAEERTKPDAWPLILVDDFA